MFVMVMTSGRVDNDSQLREPTKDRMVASSSFLSFGFISVKGMLSTGRPDLYGVCFVVKGNAYLRYLTSHGELSGRDV